MKKDGKLDFEEFREMMMEKSDIRVPKNQGWPTIATKEDLDTFANDGYAKFDGRINY